MAGYVKNVLIGLDRLGNTILAGDPDETISARSGRLRHEYPHTWGILARLLNGIQPDHVELAVLHDELRGARTAEKEEDAIKKGF